MLQDNSLFAELEATLAQGAGPQRFTILRKMTDLFLAGADVYSDEHVAVFDELMSHLIQKIERQALVELSSRLAPASRAPANVIGRLSHDDDIEISGPILERSIALSDNDLVEIAETKGQAHLSAIAGRTHLNEQVTDVLIYRGDADVARKVTANHGARFSRFGLVKAVSRAEQDETLAVAVVNRADLPQDLLQNLVRKATETVRQRLLVKARPEMRERISEVVSKISGQVARSVAPAAARGSGKTLLQQDPVRLRARLTHCADQNNVEELVDAFSILSKVPVKTIHDLVRQSSDEGLMILGKVSGLGWPDMQKVLAATVPSKTRSPDDSKELCSKFVNLSSADAQRAIQFLRTKSFRGNEELRKLV